MSRRTVQDVPSTPHFNFLYGAFRLSKWSVPYFTTTISLEEAARDLHLTNDIPGAEEINWKLDELYQRDLDWPRVERNIVPYLRKQDVPQFFNSITIALLPYDQEKGELLSSFGSGTEWNPPPLADPDRYEKTLEIGPLSFGFWDDWNAPADPGFASGQLRWNTNQVFGVAIDGQHRLAAIKSFAEATHGSKVSSTRVPVIFLLFDERAGYEFPVKRPIVELLRTLFIDLNKHAQTVKRARQILLDDRDPHAVCVRRLVGQQMEAHTSELNVSPPRLPLALVDWHREQAKFDDGPYLATVLGLDWIVSQVLATRPVSDFTDYGALLAQVGRIERQLGIELRSARERIEQLQSTQLSPFVYSDEELDQIRAGFADVWARPLCELLTKFKPYADFLARRINDDTLSLEFQNWYRLFDRAERDAHMTRDTIEYKQFLERLGGRGEKPIGEALLKGTLSDLESAKAGSLAFNVVFQRAFILAFLEFAKIDEGAIDELEGMGGEEEDFPDFGVAQDDALLEAESDIAESDEVDAVVIGEKRRGSDELLSDQKLLAQLTIERAEQFLNYVNRLVARYEAILQVGALFESEDGENRLFWLGTLRKPEGGIDFTQAASKRAMDLLFVAAAMCLFDERVEPGDKSDFDKFWEQCIQRSGPSICNRVGRAIERFSKQERSAAGRILSARDDDFDADQARDEAYVRMKFLWETLGL
jgi:hypothetical protein